MKRMIFFVVILLMAGLLGAVHSAPVAAASDPIKIEHCIVTKPKAFSSLASGTEIVYVNTGSKPAKSITFAVGYRNAASHFYRRVTDQGHFAPYVTIKHQFKLYSDVTYAGEHTSSCAAIAVKWSDGSTWSY